MAITTLIAGGTGGDSTVFVFDALTEKQVEFSSSVSKHPVETGSDITDNVVNENTTIDITGIVTNTPVEGMVDSIAQNREVEEQGNRVQQAYDLLTELRNNKIPFTIITELDSFPICVITSLSFPEEGGMSNMDVLEVKMEVEQIRLVDSQGIFVSNVAPEQQDDSQDTSNEGSSSAVGDAEVTSSVLRSLEVSQE